MSEAARIAQAEVGPATQLVAFYADGSDEAVVAAGKLSLEMIAETATWFDGNHDPHGPEAAEKIRMWWLNQVRIGADPEDAEELEQRWSIAFEKAKRTSPPKDVAKAEAKPKPKEAKALEADPAKGPKAKAWPDAPQPPDGATELEKLTYPHGPLGHVVQYIVDTAQLPDRWMALAGALSVCAKALDRKVIGPRDNSVVLWTVLLSETGAGKQHILSCIRTILRAIGMENVLAASGIASLQSVEELLTGIPDKVEGQPSPLVDIDEYGSFLTRISSKGQTGNVSEIPSTLQTLWGWPPEDPWHGSIKVGKKVVDVFGPAFAIFGASTKRAFFSALKKKEVSELDPVV